MIKRVDNAVFLSAKDFIDNGGKLAGGYRSFGLKEDGVGLRGERLQQGGPRPGARRRSTACARTSSAARSRSRIENTDMAAWAKTLK